MTAEQIIERYYKPGTPLHRTLTVHSRQVADLAAEVCARLAGRGVAVDAEFVREAALLHDVGIFRTDAPAIHCTGTAPYICHGVLGRELLDELGWNRHALVCERHTGAGLSLEDIVSQRLPLPHRSMLPVTIEEKVVCYADKFFSKTHVGEPARSLERVRRSLAKFGPATLARFEALHQLLG